MLEHRGPTVGFREKNYQIVFMQKWFVRLAPQEYTSQWNIHHLFLLLSGPRCLFLCTLLKSDIFWFHLAFDCALVVTVNISLHAFFFFSFIFLHHYHSLASCLALVLASHLCTDTHFGLCFNECHVSSKDLSVWIQEMNLMIQTRPLPLFFVFLNFMLYNAWAYTSGPTKYS